MLTNIHGPKRPKITQAELNRLLTAHEHFAAGRGGARTHFKLADLEGLNLANRVLNEIDFSGASLVDASFHGSNLSHASFYCADLRGADLRNTKMQGADLRGASFKGARLAYAVLDNADLRAASMMYTGPDGVVISSRTEQDRIEREAKKPLSEHGVDFSNCSLKHVSFGNAKLQDVDFSGALLQGASFKGAQLANVRLRGAVLTGVNLSDLNLPPEAFAECVTDSTPESVAKAEPLKKMLETHQLWITSQGAQGAAAVLDGEDLRPLSKDFAGRQFTGLSMRNAIALGVDFSGCQLQGAKFDGADLRDADFTGADLCGVSFKGANLVQAQFAKARLGNLRLISGDVMAPSLHGAQAVPQQFRNTILETPIEALGLDVPALS